MVRIFCFATLFCMGNFTFAQHSFYMDLYTKANTLSSTENWELAATYYEIAAFGFLENEDLLFDTYLRLIDVLEKTGQQHKLADFIFRARILQSQLNEKPKDTPNEIWETYLVLSKQKKPTAPQKVRNADDWESHLKKNPTEVSGWMALLDLYEQKGDTRNFSRQIAKAVKANPRDESLLERAALFFKENKNQREADRKFDALFALNPKHPVANEYFGNKAVSQKKYNEAQVFYRWVTQPVFKETARFQADLRSAEKQEEEQSQKKAQNQPKHTRNDANKKPQSESPKQLTRPKKSEPTPDVVKTAAPPSTQKPERSLNDQIKEKEALIATEPYASFIEPQLELLDLYFQDNRLSKVRRLLRKMEDRFGKDPRYLTRFFRYSFLKARFTDSIANAPKDRESLSNDAKYYLGLCYLREGQFQAADQLLGSLPDQGYPLLKTSKAQIESGLKENQANAKRAKAEAKINSLEAKVRGNDATPDERAELADIYIENDDWRRAKKLIEDSYESDKRNVIFQYYMGRLNLEQNNFEYALQFFRNVLHVGYTDRESIFYAGLTYYKSGDFISAKQHFQQALQKGSNQEQEIKEYLALMDQKKSTAKNEEIDWSFLMRPIKNLESLSAKESYIGPRLALLRLYFITGNQQGFAALSKTLSREKLNEEQTACLEAWQQLFGNHSREAKQLVGQFRGEEPTFIKGYIQYLEGDFRSARAALAPLKDNLSVFPEVAKLLEKMQ